MKTLLFRSLLLLAICGNIAACSGGGGGSSEDGGFSTGGGSIERQVIENYVNNVIIEIYSRLDQTMGTFREAVTAFVAAPSDATLAGARAAWVAAREPWEQSETALFGPVDFYGFDPALDTWPVNQTDLNAVLNSSTVLSTETVANLDNSLKGFHTAEYLLFGNGGSKTPADFTTREFAYLQATTENLKVITDQMLRAWTTGIQGQGPYALELTAAGQGSTTYPTERAAIEEMVRGMIGICDEVANGKIADPFDTRNSNIVESQFSFNSITDFANNIGGVKLALERAVSAFIASHDSSLNTRLIAEVDSAIAAILAIPRPFRNAILDSSNDATIIAAQQAIRRVQATLEGEVLPLVLDS